MIERLQRAPLSVQVALLVGAPPLVVALFGLTFAPMAVEVAMAGQPRPTVLAVVGAVRVITAVVVLLTATSALAAALLLRGSLRSAVQHLHVATSAIASGDFGYRVASARGDEIGALAMAIDAMAGRLEQLEGARRRMLACVSHELRTPLTIMRNQTYALQRRSEEPDARERLALMEREAGRLTSLIDDLVDTASLHAGGLRLERVTCDLRALCLDAGQRFRRQAALSDVGIAVRAPVAAPVMADPGRIEQVLANVVGNAVRHAAAGSAIEIILASHGPRGERRVLVRNRGPEIAAADSERIFEPFEQTGPRPGRAGLGLALARGIVAAHGGLLALSRTGDDGWVEFLLELPAPMEPTDDAVSVPTCRSVRRRAARNLPARLGMELT